MIPPEDRRYAVFYCSEEIPSTEYFNELGSAIDNDEFGRELYNFLRNLPQEYRVNIKHIPSTSIREKMIEASIPRVELFFRHLIRGDISLPRNITIQKHNGNLITSDEFYKFYTSWCGDNKYTTVGKNTFGETAESKEFKERRFYVGQKQVRGRSIPSTVHINEIERLSALDRARLALDINIASNAGQVQ